MLWRPYGGGARVMFDYVMVLVSVVIGLAMTHLMQGVVDIIQNPARMKPWWVHLCWVLLMLFTSVFFWWFEYQYHTVQQWTFGLYLLLLVYAFNVYVAAALLFPFDQGEFTSYEDYFIAKRRWFLSLFIIAQILDVIDTAMKGASHLEDFGVTYLVAEAVFVALAAIGIWTENRKYHAFLVLTVLAYWFYWAFAYLNTVG
jgi:hypothetical protein